MSTLEVLTALQNSPLGYAIGKTDHLVGAAAQVFHVLGFVFLLASVILINLRLSGFALTGLSIPQVAKEPTRLIWAGLAFAVISGILMFLSAPLLYYTNPAFVAKIWLLAAAVLLQVTLYRRVTTRENPNPVLAKASVVLSILLWFGVGVTGRAIGFI
ncbi:DUF6644 family protein [Dechloromonas denitrificans]|uniref:DUF6644 family protein n=1 Tax=Dechloromonas denitrificans TaxID=281362 RepID=UPI001CF8AA8E|nr:DUF6644 family protein [Dechloromonas denitrificans]UCV01663.1 hypothetical protein KI611_11045 [Dechloromonas denitrificans]UCV06031.1 hypothetical protein KI615_11295 [Dechloromonas denitrificans]